MNMNQDQFSDLVSHEWSIKRILLLVVMVMGVAGGVVATLTLRDVRSRASIPQVSPSPFFAPTPLPALHLTPPYIRLITVKDTYGLTQEVPIDVYLHTDGKNTMEAAITLSYDSELLAISQDDITSTDVYQSINVTAVDDGLVSFSLFVNPQIGQPGVATSQETKIATLTFRTRTNISSSTTIKVEFDKGSTETTNLISYSESRPETPQNLLEAVEGVSFKVAP